MNSLEIGGLNLTGVKEFRNQVTANLSKGDISINVSIPINLVSGTILDGLSPTSTSVVKLSISTDVIAKDEAYALYRKVYQREGYKFIDAILYRLSSPSLRWSSSSDKIRSLSGDKRLAFICYMTAWLKSPKGHKPDGAKIDLDV